MMKRMTTVFVIGGFNIHHTLAASEKIRVLQKGLERKGYRVILVDIAWRRKSISKFVAEFKDIYRRNCTEENVVIGNSFGAIVALMTGVDLLPNELYLCSLSAFFKEDQQDAYPKLLIRRFGVRRANELGLLSFNDLARRYKDTGIAVTVTYGELELDMYPKLVGRCKQAARLLPDARLVELKDAPHSMGDPVYAERLLRLLPRVSS